MKRLLNIQKLYLDNLLWRVHDYTSYEDLHLSETIALRLMCGERDQDNLEQLVDRYIKKWYKDNIYINEEE